MRWIAEELIPEVAAAKLARYCDAFCDDHAFTVQEAHTVLTAAKRNGLGLRVHAEQVKSGSGAVMASILGAATADHLEAIEDEDLHHLWTAGTQPILLPGSVFALGRDRYPPARKMVERGLGIVLATDFNAACSLGMGDRVGSLEAGKEADFLIHEFTDYRELAYFIAAPFRPRVFIAGNEVTP